MVCPLAGADMIAKMHSLRPAVVSYVAARSPAWRALAVVVFVTAAFLWTFQDSEQ